ncbi:hypothetical protein D3C76_1492460 [compost metagenome]
MWRTSRIQPLASLGGKKPSCAARVIWPCRASRRKRTSLALASVWIGAGGLLTGIDSPWAARASSSVIRALRLALVFSRFNKRWQTFSSRRVSSSFSAGVINWPGNVSVISPQRRRRSLSSTLVRALSSLLFSTTWLM